MWSKQRVTDRRDTSCAWEKMEMLKLWYFGKKNWRKNETNIPKFVSMAHRSSTLIHSHRRGFVTTHRNTTLLCTSDQPVAVTYTWQHTTISREKHPCFLRESNPQSQQARGRRPTPYIARPLGCGNPTCTWKNNIKLDSKERGCENGD
jgi:hypothetical protein